jgi:hypothetical protein
MLSILGTGGVVDEESEFGFLGDKAFTGFEFRCGGGVVGGRGG